MVTSVMKNEEFRIKNWESNAKLLTLLGFSILLNNFIQLLIY